MKKLSVGILGLGKYGRSLAEGLYDLGMDVMVADRDPDLIADFGAKSTVAVRCDLAEEEDVKALALQNLDIVVVAMSSDLAASILCVAVAKEAGVPLVIAKASTARTASILRRVGADRTIDPEKESGMRSARVLASPNILEFFDVDENLCLLEMPLREGWAGRTLKELDLRRRLGLNVIAWHAPGRPWSFVDPALPLPEGDTLLVALEKKSLRGVQ